MTTHPNHIRVQEAWDAIDQGDLSPIGTMITPDVAMVHGPGAGPFAGPSEGVDRLLEMSLFFAEVFAGSFHQKGRCIYADDDWAIAARARDRHDARRRQVRQPGLVDRALHPRRNDRPDLDCRPRRLRDVLLLGQ